MKAVSLIVQRMCSDELAVGLAIAARKVQPLCIGLADAGLDLRREADSTRVGETLWAGPVQELSGSGPGPSCFIVI